MTDSGVEPLHRRMRDRMRSEIADTAADLFLTHGFDETTVDEICEAAGLSRRSFFRYFKGKEDVVVSVFTALAEQGCQAFVASPASEDIWTALRHSMNPFIAWVEQDPTHARALLRLIDDSPALRASYLDRVDRWRASLAAVIATKVDADAFSVLQISVIAAACMGAYVSGARAWAGTPKNSSPAIFFDEAFAVLQSGLPATASR